MSFNSNRIRTTKPHILVVDDSPIMLRGVRNTLTPMYDVSLATSAAEGMNVIKRRKPDLILLDYEMPDCNGKEMLEKLRMDIETFDIPVVFLTSVNKRAEIEQVLPLCPEGYLLKPLKSQMMLETIRNILNGTQGY